jgi:hypothetical protein
MSLRLLGTLLILASLASCNRTPQHPVTYRDVLLEPRRFRGDSVSWVGTMLMWKSTMDASGKTDSEEYIYLAEGSFTDSTAGPFVLLSFRKTPAADSLDRTSGAPGERTIIGRIHGMRPESLYVNGVQRIMQAPVLRDAIIDAPPAAPAASIPPARSPQN